MTDKKTSQEDAVGAVDGTEIVRISQLVAGVWTDFKATFLQILSTGKRDWSGLVRTVANETITLILAAPDAGVISSTKTKCKTGTATVTFAINGTALGGTANSGSSSLDSQAHTTANTFAAGDTISVTFSANAACVDLSFVIDYQSAAA